MTTETQYPRAGDGKTLTAEQVEKLAAAEGVKFQRIYRPGNKAWTDITTGAVELDALTRIVSATLAAAPAAAPAMPAGWTVRDRSDLEPGAIDIEGPERARVILTRHADRASTLYALASALLTAAPAVSAPAWQPIETAPKDMGAYLFRVNGYAVQGFVDATGVHNVQNERGEWRKMRGTPTHWMPLPAAQGFQAPAPT